MKLLVVIAALVALPALAQAPQKPLRVIVPFPAGGGTDVLVSATIKADIARWAPIVKASGFTAED